MSKCVGQKTKCKVLERLLVHVWTKHFDNEISEDRALELVDKLKGKFDGENYFSDLIRAMQVIADKSDALQFKAYSGLMRDQKIAVLEVIIFMISDEFDEKNQGSIENQKQVLKFLVGVWAALGKVVQQNEESTFVAQVSCNLMLKISKTALQSLNDSEITTIKKGLLKFDSKSSNQVLLIMKEA